MIYSLPPILTIILLVGLAGMAFSHGRSSPANRLLIVLFLLGSLLFLDVLITFNAPSKEAALLSNRIGHLFHPFLIPLFVHFFHSYLGIHHRRWVIRVAYIWAILLSATSQTPWFIERMGEFYFGYFGQGGRLYWLMGLGAASVTLYNLFIIYQAIKHETNSNRKNKLKYVFTGFGLTGVLTSLNILTMFGLPIYPLGCFGFIPLGIFGAGVFLHDLLDMGLLIRKSLFYSLLTGLLTGLYALIIITSQMLFKDTTDTIVFPLVLFALITFIFGPVKSRIQKKLDQVFEKDRYSYRQTIKSVSRTIATILDYDDITRLLNGTIITTMGVTDCALYLERENGYEIYATAGYNGRRGPIDLIPRKTRLIDELAVGDCALYGRQLEDLWRNSLSPPDKEQAGRPPEVALPMTFKKQLKGFLLLGAKQSGAQYRRDDIELLETLGHQSALAIENTRAYMALNELNRSLEEKVRTRTHDLAQALAEKERTQEQLIRSESLAALGQLVAGVAHELNNPLTSVTSLLQSFQEEVTQWPTDQLPDEDLADLIDDLKFADKELARAKAIVASLLGLARQTQTYEEQVDLNLVVGDALRILHNQFKHAQIELVEQFEDGLPLIMGNFANLGQVALNIIKNAFQAAPEEGGKLELRTYYDSAQYQVVFTCQDNGPGIDPQIRQDVFKPFFTTKPVGQGTGLGLYICHEIITKHNGSITIEPETAEGTKMVVQLPV